MTRGGKAKTEMVTTVGRREGGEGGRARQSRGGCAADPSRPLAPSPALVVQADDVVTGEGALARQGALRTAPSSRCRRSSTTGRGSTSFAVPGRPPGTTTRARAACPCERGDEVCVSAAPSRRSTGGPSRAASRMRRSRRRGRRRRTWQSVAACSGRASWCRARPCGRSATGTTTGCRGWDRAVGGEEGRGGRDETARFDGRGRRRGVNEVVVGEGGGRGRGGQKAVEGRGESRFVE